MHRDGVIRIGNSIKRTHIIGLPANTTEKANADERKENGLDFEHRFRFLTETICAQDKKNTEKNY